jgi:hypothetical protein
MRDHDAVVGAIRGLRSFNDGTADIPRITKHLRLPAFQYAGLEPYTWPRLTVSVVPSAECCC